ncbi:MAG: efflux RND transporter permease subunit [Saprospiraceae bacterium]
MRSVIQYFIKYPIAANLLIVTLLILGLFGYRELKTTFFPERPSRIITVQAIYPGASPEEVEEGIVNKIEDNLKGLTGLEQVTSSSSENSGNITIEVQRGYDTDLILQDVKNSIDRINSFPVGMEPLVIFKQENIGFAISFALSGEVDLRTLKAEARKIEDDLLAMDEISKVALSGFPEEEIEIAFNEDKLRAYDLTFSQAAAAVRGANLDITGGSIKGDREEYLIRARNKSYYAQGLKDIIVKKSPDGGIVYLYQVAEVRDRWADNPDRTYLNDQPSVTITVSNTLEEDMITITDKVNEYIETFNSRESIIKATVIRDGSIVLRQRMKVLSDNGIIGFFLVILSLAMFLHWRLAFWVALAIPICFAGMFAIAPMLGISINVISLFGMIVVIGILVDDGIVVSENIYQRYEMGDEPVVAATNGTMMVLPAVFSAILTTVIAFSTFFFIEGRLGDIFGELSIVVIVTLVFSLIEAALTLPTHISHSLVKVKEPNKVMKAFDATMAFMRDRMYAPILKFVIKNKWITLTGMVALLWITFGSFTGGIIQSTFFPNIERDNISVELKMPAGTRDYITMEVLDRLEKSAWEANAILSKEYYNDEKQAILNVEKKIGPSTYVGNVNITLLDGEARDPLTTREIINKIRELTGPVYEAEQLTFGSFSPFGKPISISLVGSDKEALASATEEVKHELKQLAELQDVVDDNLEGLQEIQITLKEKAKYLGLQVTDVLSQVRQGFFGAEAQRLQRGQDEVRVWVRYDLENRNDITQLSNMRIKLADGSEYPVGELVDLEQARGVISINHIDGRREIKIEADVANDKVSVSDLTSNIKEEIVPAVLKNYPSVSALYEGQNREQQRSQESIQKIFPIVLLLMFIVIALTFNSISQAFILLATIPFGFIGVGWGHWMMEAPISLFSFLGIIALVGIMVNDGLVFVTTYNNHLEMGMEQDRALFQTGMSRFRAIFLTTATTVLGLAPIIADKSTQAQFLIPMAISVSFGLVAATIVILVLLPSLLMIGNRVKLYAYYAWYGERPAPRMVEPAVEGRHSQPLIYAIGGLLMVAGFVAIIMLLNKLAGFLI